MTFPEELDMSPFIDVEDEVAEAALASVSFTHSQLFGQRRRFGAVYHP